MDPSPNIHDNPYVHERAEAGIEEYTAAEPFDLLTLRMVAEHITRPADAVRAMARLVRPGGRVVVYTIHKFSPVSLAAWALPFGLHHPIKKLIWRTDEKDTFPVAYRMNTRRALRGQFAAHGFREGLFAPLDDCRTFARFGGLNHAELLARRGVRAFGLGYRKRACSGCTSG